MAADVLSSLQFQDLFICHVSPMSVTTDNILMNLGIQCGHYPTWPVLDRYPPRESYCSVSVDWISSLLCQMCLSLLKYVAFYEFFLHLLRSMVVESAFTRKILRTDPGESVVNCASSVCPVTGPNTPISNLVILKTLLRVINLSVWY